MICSILTPTPTHPQGPHPPSPPQPLGMGCVGVRMLHIMLCIMLHVLDQKAYTPPLKSRSPLKVDQNTCVLRSTFKGGSVHTGLSEGRVPKRAYAAHFGTLPKPSKYVNIVQNPLTSVPANLQPPQIFSHAKLQHPQIFKYRTECPVHKN